MTTPEQRARDLLERLSDCTYYTDPQRLSAGDVVELANIFAEIEEKDRRISDLSQVVNLKSAECEKQRVEIERKTTALENIAAIDYTRAATTGACSLAVRIAKEALQKGGAHQ